MAQVPDYQLRDWISRLDHAASAPNVDQAVAEELGLLAGDLRGLLGESHPMTGDKRRGLGRGLESLIPTGTESVVDIQSLRDSLRRIAASATTSDAAEPEGVSHGSSGG